MNLNSVQRGVSLVELLVAMTLGLILTAGVVQLLVTNSSQFQFSQAISHVQENGQFGVNYLTYDLRMAGYSGSPRRYQRDFESGGYLMANNRVAANVHGLDFSSETYKTSVGYYQGAAQVPPLILLDAYTKDGGDTDMVTIQRLAEKNEMTCSGSPMGRPEVILSQYKVTQDNELQCTTYFADGDTKTDSLLSGVRAFQVLYGVDFASSNGVNSDSGNGAAETWVNATQLKGIMNDASLRPNNEPHVVAIRMGLLVESDEQMNGSSESEVEVLDQTVNNLSSDRFRRRYSTTIQLRNVERSI